MTHTIAHRIGPPLLAVCCSLVVALATAVATAQDPPNQPSAPQDQPPGPAADRTEGTGPGRPMPERRFHGDWQGSGQQFRFRTSEPSTQRLDALEAKLDTLLNEVRQLRREINRQRTGSSSHRPGPRYGQGAQQRPDRGDFRRDGQRPPHGPRPDFSMRHQFQPPFGPPFGKPFGRPDFAAPDRRGPDGRGPVGRHQGPQSFREFRPGPGPGFFNGPQDQFGPPPRPRRQRGDSDTRDQRPNRPRNEDVDRGPDGPRGDNMDRGPDGPRRDNLDRGPDGPRGDNMDRGPDGPRRENMNRGPDGPRRDGNRGFGGSENPGPQGPDGRRFDGPPRGGPDGPGDRGPEPRSGDSL